MQNVGTIASAGAMQKHYFQPKQHSAWAAKPGRTHGQGDIHVSTADTPSIPSRPERAYAALSIHSGATQRSVQLVESFL